MVKKILCMGLGALLLLAGCGGQEGVQNSQEVGGTYGEEPETKRTPSDKKTLSDAPLWSEEFALSYLDYMDFDIYDFSKEEKELTKKLGSMGKEDQCYVSNSGLLSVVPVYKQVYEETEYIYTGELKKERPDGYGQVVRVTNVGTSFEPEYVCQLVYRGMFKKGKYDGFGKKYFSEIEKLDEYDNIYQRYIIQTVDPQETVTQYFNELEYFGYFEDGDYEGRGVLIEYPDKSQIIMAQDEELKNLVDMLSSHLDVITGEYKNGQANGAVKIYTEGRLWYDGDMKNGQCHNKGTEYYIGMSQKKYEGEFSNGIHEGNGTLYDPDGNEVCSGEWKNDMCGMVNINDYLSPYVESEWERWDALEGSGSGYSVEPNTEIEADTIIPYVVEEETVSETLSETDLLPDNEIEYYEGANAKADGYYEDMHNVPYSGVYNSSDGISHIEMYYDIYGNDYDMPYNSGTIRLWTDDGSVELSGNFEQNSVKGDGNFRTVIMAESDGQEVCLIYDINMIDLEHVEIYEDPDSDIIVGLSGVYSYSWEQ